MALFQKRQENDLPIRKFQRVVMGGWDFFVDLTEDRSPVLDRALTPRPKTVTPNVLRERQFCARWDANGYARIFWRAEASCPRLEKPGGQLVTDFS